VRRRHRDDDVNKRDDYQTAVHDVPAAGQVGASSEYKTVGAHLFTDITAECSCCSVKYRTETKKRTIVSRNVFTFHCRHSTAVVKMLLGLRNMRSAIVGLRFSIQKNSNKNSSIVTLTPTNNITVVVVTK